ncbi:MAG TPA: nucleotide exchange factor GrpE [Nitrospirota bacterium]|nr:nucleotide exchange factor GrpE [Nitrospirota bacterium]
MTKKHNKHLKENEEVIPPVTEEQTEEAAVPTNDPVIVARLSETLEQKTKEAAEANEKYLRTYAEFENYRKRMQRDLAEFRKYANEQLAFELLTVVDHLGLALKHAEEAGGNIQGLQEGVELVYKQLRDVLEKFGVKEFAAEGEPFDPARHDALLQVESEKVPENTVVQVVQDGYLYYDKVLRHAKVGVSKRPPKPENIDQQNAELQNEGFENTESSNREEGM